MSADTLLLEDNQRLREELAAANTSLNIKAGQIIQLWHERDEARAKVGRLRGYAKHDFSCPAGLNTKPPLPCVCGLEQELADAPPPAASASSNADGQPAAGQWPNAKTSAHTT